MSSDDCKNFIESLCDEHALKHNDKWKRVKKHKEGDLVLRDFENKSGDTIVIAENKAGELSLYCISKDASLPEDLKATLGKEKLLLELFKLSVQVYSETLEEELQKSHNYFTRDEGGVSEAALLAYFHDKDESLLKKDISQFKINKRNEIALGHNIIYALEDDDYYVPEENFIIDTHPDKVGILYDKENADIYLHKTEDISYFIMHCGGDWECSVMSFIYWSEKDQRLKGFFPTGDGNVYNQETDTAYGSEFEKLNIHYGDPQYNILEEKFDNIRQDIDENFDKYYGKAEKIAFKQFKEHLLAEYKNTNVPKK